MSYYLMVFDPEAAPASRPAFLAWFHEQTRWGPSYDYNDPGTCTPRLRAWFDEMSQRFPPMNGPFASDDFDDPAVSDYAIGPHVIYVAFSWSEAQPAHDTMFALAQRHLVGFYDVSDPDENRLIWTPPRA